MSRTSGEHSLVPEEAPKTFLKDNECMKDRQQTETELVPPLQGLCDPRVIELCQLFTEEDVEESKVDIFPLFSPFINGE